MLYNLTDKAIKWQRFLERHQQATEQRSGPRSRSFAVKELQAIKQGSRTHLSNPRVTLRNPAKLSAMSRTMLLRLILLAIHITGSLCVTCPSIGCSLESVGCQVLNTVLKCSGKDITGSLNINNLPTNLETIYLNSNRISNVASTQFRNLRNLKRLYLSNNQLTHLALELFSSNQELEILTLGNNLLTTLDQNLFLPLVELLTLDLSHNQLGSEHFKTDTEVRPALHARQFVSNTRLQMLDLYSNQIPMLSPIQFISLSSLETLRLNDNNIANLSPNQFTENPALVHLDVRYNPLDFVESGCVLPSPASLDCTKLKGGVFNSFADVPATTVTSIDLSFANLAKVSSNALEHYKNLIMFNASNNQLESLPLNIFDANKQLTTVDFSANPLDFVLLGCSMVGRDKVNCTRRGIEGQLTLRDLPRMKLIDISGNFLDSVESECFSPHADYLEVINLSHNRIVDLSAATFDANSNLKQVSLEGNPIVSDDYECDQHYDYRVAVEVVNDAGNYFYACLNY